MGNLMNKIKSDDISPGYDIVVIGGGAAGCSFLYHLKNSKYSTLMIDYRSFPRKKACSGILVAQAKDFLESMPKPRGIFAKPNKLDFVYDDWDHNKQKNISKNFFNTYRYKLDNWLFSLLKNKEIQVLESSKLIDFNFTKDKKFIVLFIESNGEIKTIVTKYLVGCDGAMSIVRKKISKKEIPMYVAMQEIIPNHKIKHAHFIYDEEVTDFYSWMIPKDNGVEIGSAVNPFKAKEKFEFFKKKVEYRTGIKGSGVIESAIVLRPTSIKDIYLGKENIFLCGEAAVLISPSSAEGISYALRSGKICAESFNHDSTNPFKTYIKNMDNLLKRLEQKFEKSKIISHKIKRKKLMTTD